MSALYTFFKHEAHKKFSVEQRNATVETFKHFLYSNDAKFGHILPYHRGNLFRQGH